MIDRTVKSPPLRTIISRAPTRIADLGGWTDTWFARHGKVLNIAVNPGVEVRIDFSRRQESPGGIRIHAENYGDEYTVDPSSAGWLKHPLIEAALRQANAASFAPFTITISSEIPPGASMGTSASVAVALVGALAHMSSEKISPSEVAMKAYRVESEMLGLESGIQDQLCAAHGGVNCIEIDNFPAAKVQSIPVKDNIWDELDRRLILIYLGASHSSSEVHKKVIAELKSEGPGSPRLEALRRIAERGVETMKQGDLAAFGEAMIANTEAQAALHPELVSHDARRIIRIARDNEATGWKVNGAGGEGGTVTILCGDDGRAKAMLCKKIADESPKFRVIPIRLSRQGLTVSQE